jgi:hypothetical protein
VMIGDRSSDLARVEFMAVRRQKHELHALSQTENVFSNLD